MYRLLTTLLVVTAAGTLGCNFLEDNADVTHEVEIPVSFRINGSELCEQAAKDYDCSKMPMESPPEKVSLGTMEIEQNIDVVEATGRTELRESAGRFKEITVSKIEYDYTQNSLSFGTPAIDLLVSPKAATKNNYSSKFSDQTVQLTTIPSVEPGANESGTADVSSDAEKNASPLFKKLEFSQISKGEPSVGGHDDNRDKVPPGGSAKVDLTMFVKFVANPVDAAN